MVNVRCRVRWRRLSDGPRLGVLASRRCDFQRHRPRECGCRSRRIESGSGSRGSFSPHPGHRPHPRLTLFWWAALRSDSSAPAFVPRFDRVARAAGPEFPVDGVPGGETAESGGAYQALSVRARACQRTRGPDSLPERAKACLSACERQPADARACLCVRRLARACEGLPVRARVRA